MDIVTLAKKYQQTLIPLHSGTKIPACKWKNHPGLETIPQNFNIGLRLHGRVFVIDIDTPAVHKNIMERLFEKNTLVVQTRRGFHFYFLASNFHPKNKKILPGIDMKAEGGYVVVPPSSVDGFQYSFLNVSEIQEITLEELNKIFEIQKSQNNQKNEQDSIQDSTSISDKEKLKQKIIQIICEYWTPGNRQKLALYLAGFLRKRGFSFEEVSQILSEICSITADEEIEKRLSAVTYTYNKDPKEIAGISGLAEMLPAEKVKELIQTATTSLEEKIISYLIEKEQAEKIFQIENIYFFVREHKLYALDVAFKKKQVVFKTNKVGPFIEIEDVYFDEDKQRYIYNVKIGTKKFPDFCFRVQEIEKNQHLLIRDTAKWKMYFDFITENKILNPGIYTTRTGWFFIDGKEFFLTPSFQLNIDRNYTIDQKKMGEIYSKFIISRKEELHSIIQNELKEGTTLGLLFLCAASAPFLIWTGTSFSVFLSGAAGTGKTTAALAACNLFYNNATKLTLYGTQNFRERVLYTLCDMPLLLDESALEKDEKIEVLLFLVESQKTKGRSNIFLGLDVHTRRNVLFLTSERELDLSRLGVFRRCLFVNLENVNLERTKYILNKKLVGAGYDYIEYAWQNKERIIQYFNEEIREKTTIFEPARALYLTLHILEGYYNENFSKLRDKVESIITEHEKKADFFEFAKSALKKFYFENVKNFYDPAVNFSYVKHESIFLQKPDIPKTFFGFKEKHILYIVPEIFSVFLKEYNLDRETFITTMKSKGVLIMNDRYYYKFKKVPIPMEVPNNRYIALDLSRLEINPEQQQQDDASVKNHHQGDDDASVKNHQDDASVKNHHDAFILHNKEKVEQIIKGLDIAIKEANRFADEYAFENFENVLSRFQLKLKELLKGQEDVFHFIETYIHMSKSLKLCSSNKCNVFDLISWLENEKQKLLQGNDLYKNEIEEIEEIE